MATSSEDKYHLKEGGTDPQIKCRLKISAHKDGISSLAFHTRPQILASCANFVLEPAETLIRFWDIDKGHLISELTNAHKHTIRSLQFSPFDELILASSGEDNVAKIWNWPKKECLSELDSKCGATAHKLSPFKENIIAIAGDDHIVRIWDFKAARIVSKITLNDQVRSIEFHPTNEALLAIGGHDRFIKIWKWEKGEVHKEIQSPDWAIDLKFNPHNPDILASANFGKRIYLWDISTGKLDTILREHKEEINTISFHPNNPQILLAGDQSGTIRVWNLDYASSLDKLARRLYEEIEIKDRTYHLKTYKNCMVASEIVTWLMNYTPTITNVQEAISVGASLQKEGFIQHVSDKSKVFDNSYLFYIFKKIPEEKETHTTLNSHVAAVTTIVVSSTGNIASGSLDQQIRIWN